MQKVRFLDKAGTTRIGTLVDGEVKSDDKILNVNNVNILPPVDPNKIIGVGPNHKSNHSTVDDPDNKEYPSTPSELMVFIKTTPNTIVGHEDTVILPDKGEFVYELELGVVIGKQCRNVTQKNAMDVIEGYTCINDITNIDPPKSLDSKNMLRSKSFDNAAPIGPTITSPDLVPENANMELRVNNRVEQNCDRTELIHSESALIEEISSYFTLEPGDVIATGSPSGFGPLKDKDTVELDIEGIGTLKHYVERH